MLYPGREADLNNLNLPNLPNGAAGGRAPPNAPGANLQETFAGQPTSEEEAIRNRAQTQMTANHIKSTLADLKEQLTSMKRNKAAVGAGMAFMDQQQERDAKHQEDLRKAVQERAMQDYQL